MKTKPDKVKEAKDSLDKMLETMAPYLPKPDVHEIAPQGNWGLPKEFDKCSEESKELDMAAMT